MANTKKVTITLSPDQHDEAKRQSKKLFGRENISGYFAYLIEQNKPKT